MRSHIAGITPTDFRCSNLLLLVHGTAIQSMHSPMRFGLIMMGIIILISKYKMLMPEIFDFLS